ncbi:MAG: cysteine--tRNA ligase [Candidatus Aureabacteria bacterium]|nr:cysteine--tRNA ligase [Candidatus Auribacterota bacterium]
MSLKIFNTLSGKKEDFVPLNGNTVFMYVCGITVYDDCHLGHARAYTSFDLIYRYLSYLNYDVNYVRNVTDVDDKIIGRVHEIYPGKHGSDKMKELCSDISEKYYNSFQNDMAALNLSEPDKEPRATKHIGEMIKIIKELIDKGYAYVKEGDVFFSINKFSDYGKLSKRNSEQMMVGARVAQNTKKEDPFDFALWKSASSDEPSWKSPWGEGRPGWHIECSAMSLKHLGVTLDIHGGGQDLIFPHHENEIAQSEAYTGKPFTRYWIHNGFITINREKMSKSLKNFKTLKELFEKFPPRAIKFYLLSTHYRSPLDFSDHLISAAFEGLKRIENALMEVNKNISNMENEKYKGLEDIELMDRFKNAMDDDFNSAKTIGIIFETVTELLSLVSSYESNKEKIIALKNTVLKMLGILGVIYMINMVRKVCLDEKNILLDEDITKTMQKRDLENIDIEILLNKRLVYKRNKDFKNADLIRDFLSKKNIVIRDTLSNETEWSLKK